MAHADNSAEILAKLAQLQSLLDTYATQSKTELSALAKQVESQSKLSDLRVELSSKISEFKTEINKDVSGKVADLKTEVGKELNYIKVAGLSLTAIVTILSAVLGTLGYRSLSDYRDSLKAEAKRFLNENTTFTYNLTKGATLLGTSNERAALPYLEECYKNLVDENKVDESTILLLLDAYNRTDKWENAEAVISWMEKDPERVRRISNATLLNNMGAIRVEEAVEDPAKLNSGLLFLDSAERYASVDDTDTHMVVNENLWLADLVKNDLPHARGHIDKYSMYAMDPQDSWIKIRNWRFFKDYFARPNHLKEADVKGMWESSAAKVKQRLDAQQEVSPGK